jgi:hypothetical protein
VRLRDGGDSFGAVSGLGGGDGAWPQLAGWFEQRAAQVLQKPEAARAGPPDALRQDAGHAAVRPSVAGTISAVPEPVDESGEIDYDLALTLDAEDLAEQGILEAYQQIAPRLAEYGVAAGPVIENDDSLANHYSVDFDGHRYVVYGPGVAVESARGLAAHALFDIVNRQLASTDVRFYAINGGNDLFGIFMTPEQAERARHALPRMSDWPYLPVPEPPWFGMFHG